MPLPPGAHTVHFLLPPPTQSPPSCSTSPLALVVANSGSSLGLQLCQRCAKGQYAPVKGSSSCIGCDRVDCPSGKYLHGCGGGCKCVACARYCNSRATFMLCSCLPSPPRAPVPTLLASGHCHECQFGRYFDASSRACAACTGCPPGKYVYACGGKTPTSCESCPAGKYSMSKVAADDSVVLPTVCQECSSCTPLTVSQVPLVAMSRVRKNCGGSMRGRCEVGETSAPTPAATPAPTPSPKQMLAQEETCLAEVLSWTQGLSDHPAHP